MLIDLIKSRHSIKISIEEIDEALRQYRNNQINVALVTLADLIKTRQSLYNELRELDNEIKKWMSS